MPWPKKRKASNGSTSWNMEYCEFDALTARLQALAADRWLVKYVFWDGVTPGLITIVSMQSAEYAPKEKK